MAAHAAGVVADGPAGGEVLTWLRTAFDGVRSELRVLRDAVDRQQVVLANIAESQAAAERLVDIADGLPERIGDAVSDAVRFEGASRSWPAGSAAPAVALEGVDVVADVLRTSLMEVHASAAELRNEMVRLAAFRQALADDLPTVASAVDAASKRAGGRLDELTERVNDLAGRPEWEEALRSLRFGPDEMPTGTNEK